ncbi:putative tRNA/rRNA methyltransferase [Phycisphaerae bacterium RAS1]|nr:putative tRNA/rRNA methyltransferase [Phycisphaerae bacterium RAS1]
MLVSPSGPANVGAVCRAMANMGLSKLYVVAPRCDVRDPQAVAYAAGAASVLDKLILTDDLPAALDGCVRTFCTSSKLGLYRRQSAIPPAEAARLAIDAAAAGLVAIAFGREDYGFKNEEILHFDRVLRIPADDGYPVLNLAAAVMVVCHELRKAWLEATQQPALDMTLNRDIAPHERKEVLFTKLFDALDRLGFFFGPNPDHLKYALRHLIGRMDLSRNELDILLGLAKQIRWYVDHHPPRDRRAPG